jgi:hypothetical protein
MVVIAQRSRFFIGATIGSTRTNTYSATYTGSPLVRPVSIPLILQDIIQARQAATCFLLEKREKLQNKRIEDTAVMPIRRNLINGSPGNNCPSTGMYQAYENDIKVAEVWPCWTGNGVRLYRFQDTGSCREDPVKYFFIDAFTAAPSLDK